MKLFKITRAGDLVELRNGHSPIGNIIFAKDREAAIQQIGRSWRELLAGNQDRSDWRRIAWDGKLVTALMPFNVQEHFMTDVLCAEICMATYLAGALDAGAGVATIETVSSVDTFLEAIARDAQTEIHSCACRLEMEEDDVLSILLENARSMFDFAHAQVFTVHHGPDYPSER